MLSNEALLCTQRVAETKRGCTWCTTVIKTCATDCTCCGCFAASYKASARYLQHELDSPATLMRSSHQAIQPALCMLCCVYAYQQLRAIVAEQLASNSCHRQSYVAAHTYHIKSSLLHRSSKPTENRPKLVVVVSRNA